MHVAYTHMNGLGNDFIVLRGPLVITADTVVRLCDRISGIGADGVLVVSPVAENRVRMEYWNADGSLAEMCGNGLRCVARYAVDSHLVLAGTFTVETPVGMLEVHCPQDPNERIEVQVGKVHVDTTPLALHDLTFYTASVGNPHAITFVDDVADAPVASFGPLIENDAHFPHKTNVEFVHVVDDTHLELRVWERGVGETKACGTGMVAAAVTSSAVNRTELPVTLSVPGGKARVWLDTTGFARLLGPVETTGEGEADI